MGIDNTPRCTRCQIGQEGCRVGTPLSEVRENGKSRIVCLRCGWEPMIESDTHADPTGGTNQPEPELPC